MAKTHPEVSVIIPAYNEEDYIGRLLKDLVAQRFKDLEVIVADAKSTDKTIDVINSYASQLDVKIVEAPPKNPGAGRNNGAKVARGDWLLFLDADVDTDDTDFIRTLLGKTEAKGWKTSSAKMTTKGAKLFGRIGTWLYYSYLQLVSRTKNPIGPGACILTRSDFFHQLGGFNEKITYGEDNDYITRASKEGFGYINDTYYFVDLRRFDEEGVIRLSIKNIRNEIHRLTHHSQLDESPFEYEFGKHHKNG